ncbi:cation transporter [Pseudoruegeria aquimaris]|nr:cation transporter [Pseudoruegeria aquimaris]
MSRYERQSLNIAKWANLWMAAAGLTAAVLANADALMLDGVFSGVNFLIAIVAARVAASVVRPPDASRPFGNEIDESVYVMFRALILLGIIAVAMFVAIDKILAYLGGAEIAPVNFERIMVYIALMVATCAGLVLLHHRNWRRSGRKSRLLATERTAAIIDGALSAAAGLAFFAFGAMRGTALEALVPIADSCVILLLCLVVLPQPVKLLRGAFDEVLGAGLPEEERRAIIGPATAALEAEGLRFVDLAAARAGRVVTVLLYAGADAPVAGAALDAARARVLEALAPVVDHARVEIVLTGEEPAP